MYRGFVLPQLLTDRDIWDPYFNMQSKGQDHATPYENISNLNEQKK
jgi:hypothetical protein